MVCFLCTYDSLMSFMIIPVSVWWNGKKYKSIYKPSQFTTRSMKTAERIPILFLPLLHPKLNIKLPKLCTVCVMAWNLMWKGAKAYGWQAALILITNPQHMAACTSDSDSPKRQRHQFEKQSPQSKQKELSGTLLQLHISSYGLLCYFNNKHGILHCSDYNRQVSAAIATF
jgi:hypothetical protein